MGYIDANMLKRNFDYVIMWEPELREGMQRAIELLANMPTVELHERGRWCEFGSVEEDGATHICCSQCNSDVKIYGKQYFDFCPHCGADMR